MGRSKLPKQVTENSAPPPACSKPGFSGELVKWYEASHRDLPWRNTTDPYHIWLSEIMLQQTQVATVLPYYAKFLTLFPTLQALAEAPSETVLKAWEGLGYYARCRNLHRAAQTIVEKHGGRFPETFEEVEALTGIGRSTAGAIMTFAFGDKHPILDGNVKRVLTRLYNIQEDPAGKDVLANLWEISKGLLWDAPNAYSYNQAIMELGATCCSPKNPSCLVCPVRKHCDAQAAGTQHEVPLKGEKKVLPHHIIAVGVIWDGERVLIQRRPEKGLLGGLWEFPGGKQEPGEPLETTVAREIEEELDLKVQVGEKFCTVKHAYTHFKITLHAYHCAYRGGTPNPKAADAWQWAPVDALRVLAFPKANIRVLDALDAMTDPPVFEGSPPQQPGPAASRQSILLT